ncbi:diguanylate cyclase/phosphodiesterase [Enhygromyxa salina]|uniref:Diguanylate cyclase/phosphodiesterase n=1 Tax=Enhygromyxa salina TaxID=215803 RepID=A0A0C2D1E2_9BACT|nr:GGDEF domain-containing protein [Enhygromyxa salina]KIG13977.1 diguanylate cyclase/phosphodiesterase [Enhygromyxa salina]
MPSRRRLAFLTNDFEHEFQNALLRVLVPALDEHQVELVSLQGGILGHARDAARHFVFDLVSPTIVDAVLISAHTIGHLSTRGELEQFAASLAPLPTVSLGVELEGVTSLLVDNESGIYKLVSHLICHHGHRRLAFVSGHEKNPETQARYAGYSRALRDHGLTQDPRLHYQGNFESESGKAAVTAFFAAHGVCVDDLDAIVCANDEMAAGVVQALALRGVRVPGRIAVTGFDDLGLARHLEAPLTTVRQPIEKQIRYAVERLVAAIDGAPLVPGVVMFDTEPVFRRSCGCPRRPYDVSLSRPPTLQQVNLDEVASNLESVEAELRRGAGGGLEGLGPDWSNRLASSFVRQVRGSAPDLFFDTVEDLLHERPDHHDGITAAFQDVLLALRRQAMGWAAPGTELAAHVDATCQEALFIASDIGAVALARRGAELMQRMVVLSEVTGQLMASPNLSTLGQGLQALPRVGIGSSVVALFTDVLDASSPPKDHASVRPPGVTASLPPVPDVLVIAVASDPDACEGAVGCYPTSQLAPAGYLNGRHVIVQPLTHHGTRLGLALLEYGSEGFVYELLRQGISSAVKGAQLTRAVERLAIIDPLTGLFNRRHLAARLNDELARCNRYGHALSVTVVDLDGFKRVNDVRGHDAGDRVLVRVADALQRTLRTTDVVARVGGDEFVIIEPETTAEAAMLVADRLRAALANVDANGFVAASLGVATLDEAASAALGGGGPRSLEPGLAERLLRNADQALLRAKADGKGRVYHWNDVRQHGHAPPEAP